MTTFAKYISLGALLLTAAAAAVPANAAAPVKSACTTRDADAALRSPIPVEMPPLAALEGLSGSALVQFDLDEQGVAHDAAVVTSSGYAVLDTAARKAALIQTYAPQVRDCRNVGGSYRVRVVFGREDVN